jgi:CBS domain-containing protein
MLTTEKPFLSLTAEDLMSRDVLTIPQAMSLRAAAHLLWQDRISGAPVVDAEGRCVGVLSTTDLVRWAEAERPGAEPGRIRTCLYQTQGRLLNGREAVICTRAEGECPLQAVQPTTGDRHAAVCLMPHDVLSDWQQVVEDAPADDVGKYMTPDVVTAKPGARLTDLARMMFDAHIHRVIVTDAEGRPVGVVTSTDVLAAVAFAGGPPCGAGTQRAGTGRP